MKKLIVLLKLILLFLVVEAQPGNTCLSCLGNNLNKFGWKTTGNSGTNPGTNFIGATDTDFVIKCDIGHNLTITDVGQTAGYYNDPIYGRKAFNSVSTDGRIFTFFTNQGPTNNVDSDNSIIMAAADALTGESAYVNVFHDGVSHSIGVQIFSGRNTGGYMDVTVNPNGFRVLNNSVLNFHVDTLGFTSIIDGTEGLGKALFSDANGKAHWGVTAFTQSDSATIYATAPAAGTTYTCTNCSGTGVTGRIVYYMGGAWRRVSISLLIN